jgi:hypothetical protein
MGLLIDGKPFAFDDTLTSNTSMQMVFPEACITSQEGWASLAKVYDRRERELSSVWAKIVLAACPDQLRLLCIAFDLVRIEENRVLALHTGIKYGMFVGLIRVVSEDKGEVKKAHRLFESLYAGFCAGRKYQENLSD